MTATTRKGVGADRVVCLSVHGRQPFDKPETIGGMFRDRNVFHAVMASLFFYRGTVRVRIVRKLVPA
jgi:hypothetical protein